MPALLAALLLAQAPEPAHVIEAPPVTTDAAAAPPSVAPDAPPPATTAPPPATNSSPPATNSSPPSSSPAVAPVAASPPSSPPAVAPVAASSEPRLRDRFQVFPYGWIRTDATYFSARDEGFSNIRLGSARVGGGVQVGPVLAFVTLEGAAAKGPQLFDAFVAWDVIKRLRIRAGQFKAPFGYRFNVPDLVDELPMAPVSMQAAVPGRQVGGEVSYDFWKYAQLFGAVFSGIGQNRDANATKVAFSGKLQVQPLVFDERLPQIVANVSVFAYHKTNGFTPDVRSPLGLVFYHGVPATGASWRLTAGGGVFWRFLSLRGEYFRTRDAREMDDDGDPGTAGASLPPLIGQGMYIQAGVVVTGQHKRIDNLLPTIIKGYRVRDSAVELSARYEQFRLGAEDLRGNGIQAFVGGVNWIVVQHLRLYVAGVYQRFDASVAEIPEARSWGVTGGLAGFFLRRSGAGD
jgi:hypothetical protein